jgi:hypothetical protein
MRLEKLSAHFLGMVMLAAVLLWALEQLVATLAARQPEYPSLGAGFEA